MGIKLSNSFTSPSLAGTVERSERRAKNTFRLEKRPEDFQDRKIAGCFSNLRMIRVPNVPVFQIRTILDGGWLLPSHRTSQREGDCKEIFNLARIALAAPGHTRKPECFAWWLSSPRLERGGRFKITGVLPGIFPANLASRAARGPAGMVTITAPISPRQLLRPEPTHAASAAPI